MSLGQGFKLLFWCDHQGTNATINDYIVRSPNEERYQDWCCLVGSG
jgi:hypothetical protein